MGMLGVVSIIACCYIFSSNRRAIKIRTTCWGFLLQLLLAVLVLRTPFALVFQAMSQLATWLTSHSVAGTEFVFGVLGSKSGCLAPVSGTALCLDARFAFQILPTLIFFSAIFAIGYQLGIMQPVLRGMARATQRVLSLSGAESTSVVANLVMDQTTAPLTIRPFLRELTTSELFTIMTSGMAHASGPVLAAYVSLSSMHGGTFTVDMKHLLTASVITIPGSILISKILVPEEKVPQTLGAITTEIPKPGGNVLEAVVQGTADGLSLAAMVAAIVIVFVSIVDMVNGALGSFQAATGWAWIPNSMQRVMGKIFLPIAWILGFPPHECEWIGDLMGTRLILNDFVAFDQFGSIGNQISARSATMATYALCGFANLTSVAVQVGAIGTLEPTRRHDVARLAFKALLAATLANWMASAIVGLIL